MKNIKVKKTVYIVLVILGLFIAQTFASKLGGFIADLIQYAVIDKDGTFMSISVHHIIQMIVALVLIFVISKKSDLEFWLKPRLNKSGILYTTIFDIVILMYVLISYIVGYSLNTIVPYAYELNISNVLGTINNVKKIIKYAHKNGAIVIVDASQSIPHMKIDVQDLDADFLVFSGHKMLAPLGIGVLYGKREILNKMNSFLMGGDMIEYVYEQETTFAPLPNKFEAGTQNVEGVIGLGAAIDYIENLGYDKIQEIEKEVLEYARQELSKLDYLTLYLTPNEENHSSVISFNLNGVHPHDVASILDSEGVCVRSGNHCAQPLMRFLGIDSTCRASFYFYNTKEDVDRLVKALNKAFDMFKKYIKK